ncbi:maleylacetoacetate isomerase [Aureimonas psammosilenae]|uniref:maleylacetoacetate isomerase n=1 Tax=Aureimonas psammosilenae TaxID=2495496 RepID=UPI00126115E6|nr:maleylacetoacetate isomerase [Aureimonas psammosilenae]
MSDNSFELYAFWRTSATYRVRVALALKGLTAKERIVDLEKGEQRDPEFLKLNPMGAIPALRVSNDAAPLTQSLAILEYLEETAPEPALLPADPLGRARVRSLALMMAADTHPLVVPRVRKVLTGEHGFDAEAWKAWQTRWFTTGLQAMEQRLAAEPDTGTFCHGDRVTIADICLCSIPAVMQVFGIKAEGVPTVDRIVAACNAMPEFADADPFRQEGAPAR